MPGGVYGRKGEGSFEKLTGENASCEDGWTYAPAADAARFYSHFLRRALHYPRKAILIDCMTSQIHYVTAEGLERLKAELHELKTVRRREVASRIETAKALGDLSENAEYHEAKDEMALMEGRIHEIETILKNVAVIENESGATGVARVGSTVEVEVRGVRKTFTIVGSNEANPALGRISNESPIGSALLGAKAGSHVDVKTPAGTTTYEIIDVS